MLNLVVRRVTARLLKVKCYTLWGQVAAVLRQELQKTHEELEVEVRILFPLAMDGSGYYVHALSVCLPGKDP
jgi:hypothetical protein